MWKRVLLSCFAAFLTVSATIDIADAARLGSGRSYGMQRQISPQRMPSSVPQRQQAAPDPYAARPQAPAPQALQQQSGWRRWAAPLAGLAAGIGLASLFSHFGMGGDFAGIAMAILAVVVVFTLLRRVMGGTRPQQQEPAYANSYQSAPQPYNAPQALNAQADSSMGSGSAAAPNVPAGFDTVAFERQAKVNFIRLQAANDAGNLVDIREFTSPEMFAEIKLDIDARNGQAQRTDVVMLNAEVIEVVEENARYIASVHFSGTLREDSNAAPQPFNEIWHLSKPTTGSQGWVLSGIQQIN